MIEGGSSKVYAKAKTWLFAHPEASHQLLSALSRWIVAFLIAQVQAGAQLLQVFETVGGADLSPRQHADFSLPYLVKNAASCAASF